MIVFDYATLACDKHRRHFIDPRNQPFIFFYNGPSGSYWAHKATCTIDDPKGPMKWQPDYAAYYYAADKDEPIHAIKRLIECIQGNEYFHSNIQIWCDSDFKFSPIIDDWLNDKFDHLCHISIRHRDIGDTTPWHELKDTWIKEYNNLPVMDIANIPSANKIDMAFEPSGSPMINTWKKYGVTCLEVHDV